MIPVVVAIISDNKFYIMFLHHIGGLPLLRQGELCHEQDRHICTSRVSNPRRLDSLSEYAIHYTTAAVQKGYLHHDLYV